MVTTVNEQVLGLICQLNSRVVAQYKQIEESKEKIKLAETENNEMQTVLKTLITCWSSITPGVDMFSAPAFPVVFDQRIDEDNISELISSSTVPPENQHVRESDTSEQHVENEENVNYSEQEARAGYSSVSNEYSLNLSEEEEGTSESENDQTISTTAQDIPSTSNSSSRIFPAESEHDSQSDSGILRSDTQLSNSEIVPNIEMSPPTIPCSRLPPPPPPTSTGHGRYSLERLSNGRTAYNCYCKESFESFQSLKRHFLKKTQGLIHICRLEYCGREFLDSSELLRHSRKAHNNPTYACNLCFRQFFEEELLDQHRKTEDPCASKMKAQRLSRQSMYTPLREGTYSKPSVRIANDEDEGIHNGDDDADEDL